MSGQDGEGKENGEEMRKGAGRVMAMVIVHGKATFVSSGISLSPLGDIVPEQSER